MRRPAALLVTLAVLAGCTAGPAPSGPQKQTTNQAPLHGSPSASPAPSAGTSTATTAGAIPPAQRCAAKVVAAMTPAERAGQLVMVGVTDAGGYEVAVLRRHHIGSVIIMGQHGGGVRAARQLTSRLVWKGQHTPVLVAVDQEGGLVQRLTGPGFSDMPAAKVQAGWRASTLKSRAARWARQLASAGVHLTLAPVADVVPAHLARRNAPIGRLQRGYGSDPDVVADKVAAFVEGMESSGVATSAKHFPGIGRVLGNTDVSTRVTDSVTTAKDDYLEPFRAVVEAEGSSIMVSSAVYDRIDPHHQAVYSPKVLGLLRDTMGFGGVIVSDDLGSARSVSWLAARRRGVLFIQAGGDLAITVDPQLADEFVDGITAAAKRSTTVAGQVAAAATRVVALKVKLGLVPCR